MRNKMESLGAYIKRMQVFNKPPFREEAVTTQAVHTKGPLHVVPSDNGQGWFVVSEDEKVQTAWVWDREDAELYAAAPEILEELRDTLATIEETLDRGYIPADTERALWDQAVTIRAAIAKAEGRDQ